MQLASRYAEIMTWTSQRTARLPSDLRLASHPPPAAGNSIIASFEPRGVEYGGFSVVKDTEVGEGTVIRGHCNIFGSNIGKDCKIGPMAYLEPGSSMGDRSTLRPGGTRRGHGCPDDTRTAALFSSGPPHDLRSF